MHPQSEISLLKQQVDIAILALLINIGYYKIDELHACVRQMGDALFNIENFGDVIIGSLTIMAYIVYVLSAGIALYIGIKGKEIRLACLIALTAFFAFYVISLMHEINSFEINSPSAKAASSVTKIIQK